MPIYYESRLAKLELDEAERPKIDAEFDEVTEGEEASARRGSRRKWAQLEAVVGAEKRLEAGRRGPRRSTSSSASRRSTARR